MRILIATSHRGLIGGAEKYLQEVIPGLIHSGHSVGLLYEYPFDSSNEGIDYPRAKVLTKTWRLGLPWMMLEAVVPL